MKHGLETQQSITAWGSRTFGDHHDALGMATRMNLEVAELFLELAGPNVELRNLLQANVTMAEAISAKHHALLDQGFTDLCAPTPKAGAECADIAIVLAQVASKLGVMLWGSWRRGRGEVDRKMDVNRKRSWARLPSGRHQHVEGT